ncbi:MAG: hypothetical protein LBF68_06280 [Christensenellaceae bacterium]|jgi:hypothetical protein|nr:hypothetical protein [Christensenellaceae bacterium]
MSISNKAMCRNDLPADSFVFDRRRYENSWSKFTTWQSVTPPSRPSTMQLKICRQLLSEVDKTSPVAVLGSTLEYRDLLGEMGFIRVFVFEKNRDFYDYITPFAKSKLRETHVTGDWLNTFQEYRNYFSVVLSDLTSGNIPYDYRDLFYKNIAGAISSNGIFIDRILTKSISFLPLENLVEKYRHLEVNNRNVNSFNCEFLFCSELLNNKQHIVDTSSFYKKLRALDISHISEFAEACHEITPPECKWWYSMDWNIERQTYERYWKPKEIFDELDTSEYFNRAKLLISTKRQKTYD